MATIINHPNTTDVPRESTGAGVVLGIIIAILFLIVLAVYGVPALRNAGTGAGTPNDTNNGVNVPDRIDLNINSGASGGAGINGQ